MPTLAGRLRRTLGRWAAAASVAALRPGSSQYQRRTAEEVRQGREFYFRNTPESEASRESLIEPAPPVWNRVQELAFERIRQLSGDDIVGHIVSRLRARPASRLLSLGSGPGGVELALAREAPGSDFVCLDLNPEILRLGEASARAEGLPVRFEQADLNTASLPAGAFDIVFCHASLHHVLELERLAEQIRAALRPGGELVAVDVITRSGYRMWPETRKVVNDLFRTLPSAYRVNHRTGGRPVDKEVWEGDTRVAGMECLRSEELLAVLSRSFTARLFVPYYAISRRFFDSMYGPNYDLGRKLDRAILDWIWQLDCHYLETGRLSPESFFGIYTPHDA